MEVTALLLSRLQFAFTISFHIIFPSFSIGLAAWLTILEACIRLPTVASPPKRPLVTEPQHVERLFADIVLAARSLPLC